MTATTIGFRAPSRMLSIARLGDRWTLSQLPTNTDDCLVEIDLTSWRTPTASAVVGLIATIADLCHRGYALHVTLPTHEYTCRMLSTVGFLEALESFDVWDLDGEMPRRVQRILPVIAVHPFRTESDVDAMLESLTDAFMGHDWLPASLLQDTSTVLVEAAMNVVYHAESPVGGFALVQVRQMTSGGARRHFIEIAVADPGRGVASTLGFPPDQAEQAVVHAVVLGVSRTRDPHRGVGLHEVTRVVDGGTGRRLHIHSGRGLLQKTRNRELTSAIVPDFPGTMVSVALPA